ncbi:MAG: CoA-binding protein [Synergistaceae bacterium]|nr:CoA-binding protein [Synergistaceae bacterium]
MTPEVQWSMSGYDFFGEVIDLNRDEILQKFVCTPSRVAIVGASPKTERPVFRVMNYLSGAGFTLFPVNPAYTGAEILGLTCRADLASLEERVDVVALFVSADKQAGIARDLKNMSDKPVVCFQPGSENKPLAESLAKDGYPVLEHCLMAAHMNECGA